MSVYFRSWKTQSGAKAGAWYWKFTVKGVTSHTRAVHPDNPKQKARTRAEAKAFEAIAYSRVVGGLPIFEKPKQSITFNEFVDQVYDPYAKENLRSYRQVTGQLRVLRAAFGEQIFDDISPFAVEKFKIEQCKRVSGNTVRLYLACGSAVFDRAKIEGVATSNPFRHVAIPEIEPREKRRLAREEEDALLKACYEPATPEAEGRRDALAAAIILMVELGPRPTEIFRLHLEDVSWDADPAERTIRFTNYKTGRRRKSHQSKERLIPITDRAWDALLELKAAAKDDRLYPHDSVKKAWGSVRREAKVENYWFRWLRSEAASRWADAGASPYEIAYLLGHSDVVQGQGSVTKMSMVYVRHLHGRLKEMMELASRGEIMRRNFVAKHETAG